MEKYLLTLIIKFARTKYMRFYLYYVDNILRRNYFKEHDSTECNIAFLIK